MRRVVCYVDGERYDKTFEVLRAFSAGCGAKTVNWDSPHPQADLHVIMGSWHMAQRLIPMFRKRQLAFLHIDNAWTRVRRPKFYRITRDGIAPWFLPGRSMERAEEVFHVKIHPWRRCNAGRNVLICQQSPLFGKPFGFNQQLWLQRVTTLLPSVTDRPIVVRPKPRSVRVPDLEFKAALEDAWCVVTHSSGAAVVAALAGVPVFCEPSCGAFMVGTDDYTRIEDPVRPDNREEWIASLAWQQFSLDEMRSGLAWAVLNEGTAHGDRSDGAQEL